MVMSHANAWTCPYCQRAMSDRERSEQGCCNDCYGPGGDYGRQNNDRRDSHQKPTGYMADMRRKRVDQAVRNLAPDPVSPSRSQQLHPNPEDREFMVEGVKYRADALPKGTYVTVRGQGATEFRICLPMSKHGYYGMLSPQGTFWSLKLSYLTTVRPVRGGFSLKDDFQIRMAASTWEFRDPSLKASWVPPVVSS